MMQIILELPDNILSLPKHEAEKKVIHAYQAALEEELEDLQAYRQAKANPGEWVAWEESEKELDALNR